MPSPDPPRGREVEVEALAHQRVGELGVRTAERPLNLAEQAPLAASKAHSATSGLMLGWRQRGPAHDGMG